jgi:hypothetical protein
MDVCVCSVCVFSVYIVSGDTASRPKKRFKKNVNLNLLMSVSI